ncbi:Exopolysaccharide synthesis membrane protein H (Exosortase) [uncultured Desulfobacterium sp.]|uniref:Exopolysaccharide synthesis membrane protein H (Exosortase) n=1 Tax=uncultured Desulfobacterium sp. TaxID=201089 RepID=A0A445MZU3_9BACT|nr:Exopolysaccharide synthesis membrane protein H (Exosortase) [uncultured Desulfobacterium sp.]
MNPSKYSNHISAFLLILMVSTFIFAFYPAWKNLILAWSSSDEYSHGFLMVPVALYIVWRKKAKLVSMKIQPSNWGLAFIIFSLSCYLFAYFAEISTLSSLSIVLVIIGTLLYLLGYPILKELFFPIFLLLFMIPIPAQIYSSLTVPLQLFVSKVSVAIAALLGVPIYREGNVLHLPDRTLQVVHACSGLRSMISLLTLSAVFGYLTLRSDALRTVLFISGIPVSILVNIFRVLLLVIAFYYFRFDLTTGTVHTVFGMLIFVLALISLFAIKGALSLWDKSATPE